MDIPTITALVSGVIAIVGAISGAAVLIIQALKTQSGQLKHVTHLVNSRYTELRDQYKKVLDELAHVKKLLATETGLQVDLDAAHLAREISDREEEEDGP